MRTPLVLDDELLTALLARFPVVSKAEANEPAIRASVPSDASTRLRELAGSVEIEDGSAELRSHDRRSPA